MIIKLLTEHHLEFLSLKGGCRGSSKSTLVKMSNCWKSHVTAHILYLPSVVYKDIGALLWKTRIFLLLLNLAIITVTPATCKIFKILAGLCS